MQHNRDQKEQLIYENDEKQGIIDSLQIELMTVKTSATALNE